MEAFVFPGQGSQYVGMGRDLVEADQVARDLFQEADEALGYPLSRICLEGPETELRLTANTQPAILTMSIALYRIVEREGRRPAFAAGHSLGEYSVLVASGALAFRDAVRLVHARGQFMQEAVPVGVGAMAAIIGLGADRVSELCAGISRQGHIVSAANFNAPDQTVIAGHAEAVDEACALAEAAGARRALKLPVSAPFHCDLMKPAQARLRPLLDEASIGRLSIPMINNVDAAVVHEGEEARGGLARQVTAPVRWTESIQRMLSLGVSRFVEIGPKRVLSGLIRRIAPEAEVENIEKIEQVRDHV